MWKELVRSLSEEYQCNAPATEAEILSIKEQLQVELPSTLAGLFNETNGVYGNYGITLIWSIKKMIKENLFFWGILDDEIKPLDQFLFFSDAGNGDLFGYLITDGRIQTDDIYLWSHEDDRRTVIAPSLEEFIKGWVTGKLTV
jgi:hypothetical protein